jgi:membrane protein
MKTRNLSAVAALFNDSFVAWRDDHPDLLAAGLGYFTLFSFGPLLVIATAVSGYVWERSNTQRQILDALASVIGPQASESVARWLVEAGASGKGKATVLSAIILVFGASRVFAQLRAAMDMIWRVSPPQRGFLRNLAWTWLMDSAMLAGMTIFILVFIATDALVALLNQGFESRTVWSGPVHFLNSVNLAVALLLFAALFASAYKLVPDVEIQWGDVWPGAIVASALFTAAKHLIVLYLGFQSFDTAYGAASSLIVLMVWMYFAAQIFFFGAEFTRLYTRRFGSRAR